MQTKPNDYSKNEALQELKKSIYRRAFLALFLIVLTVVMLFAVTTAWYANVARTSELMFQVSTWGFNGQIWVDDQSAITAGPGDVGGIYLTMQNESDSAVNASVFMDKTDLTDDMKKRLFFYVDASEVQNGEVVEKQYLTTQNGYDYTMMGNSSLNLTPTYHNDSEIKWEWVYDMLGYYVYGKLNTSVAYSSLENDATPITAGNTVDVYEYLRPIEYDYDEATTLFEDAVVLNSQEIRFPRIINGISVDSFLAQLTAQDGYVGTVTGNTARTPDGYYPVSIDAATGEGVWLYLCHYAEIEAGIAFDTEQGKKALNNQAADMNVTLNIYAEKLELNTKTVGSGEELAMVMQSTDVSSVKLVQDMELSTPVAIPKDKTLMIDLNGKVLTYSGDGCMATLLQGSSVVFTNGSVVGNGSNSGFDVMGSELVLNKVNASGLVDFVTVNDDTVQNDSIVRIVDCVASANTYGVYVRGNGDTSGNLTKVVLENTFIDAGYAGIISNGTDSLCGTDITVNGGRISGTYAAIYHPQKDSILTVVNSELSGMTGVVVKGGNVTLTGTAINGSGTAQTPDDSLELSGWTDTGDGIYICGAYDYDIDVQITSCNVVSAYGYAIRTYDTDPQYVYVTTYSGSFSSDVSQYVPSTSTQTTIDGMYSVTVNQ